MLAAVLVMSGCSLSVGAGAAARVGSYSVTPDPGCNDFESCDVLYRQALARAESCHEHGDNDDCESEDADAAARYYALHQQTELELAALHREVEEKDAAVIQAEQATEVARLEGQAGCRGNARPPPPPPLAAPHGNGWFESDSHRGP